MNTAQVEKWKIWWIFDNFSMRGQFW